MLYNTNIDKISKEGQKNGPTILDNIAQLPTAPKIEAFTGQKSNLKTYEKRAKGKYYTQNINGPLCYLDTPLHKMYEGAYHCNNTLFQKGDKITAKYCNSRTCINCNRIRTAKLIKGYYEPLQDLAINENDKKLEFVTLTIPNCKPEELIEVVYSMKKNLTNVIRVIREKRRIDVSGITKIECTYNDVENTFHPHFHIIVNKNSGQLIIDEWLKRYPTAAHWCQKTQKADTNSLLELFKYTTKFLIKDNSTKRQKIYTHAIDLIMQSFYKKRTIQPFGKLRKFKEEVSEEVDELISEHIEEFEDKDDEFICNWNWCPERNNWYSSNVALTKFKPPNIEFEIYY
jgi:hypothetical protein